VSAPDTLVAELTYACPLKCGYCSNPMQAARRELSTAEWTRTFDEAAALGVLQLHLTGGEPLLRDDLEELTWAARRADLYVNLITSGVGLTRDRLVALLGAGGDNVHD
jgi:pyrroloquinoline quinone biosynthesis protein E